MCLPCVLLPLVGFMLPSFPPCSTIDRAFQATFKYGATSLTLPSEVGMPASPVAPLISSSDAAANGVDPASVSSRHPCNVSSSSWMLQLMGWTPSGKVVDPLDWTPRNIRLASCAGALKGHVLSSHAAADGPEGH